MVSPALRQHVLAFGRNSTSYQILNPEFSHAWLGNAVVGYVQARSWPGGPPVWVAAGPPIGPDHALADAVSGFNERARATGARAIWFGIEPDETSLFDMHTGLVVGAQPVWNPEDWDGIVRTHTSVRAQIQRAINKQVTVREVPPEVASSMPSLRTCQDEWIASRGLPPLRFLTNPFVLDDLGDRRVFVASREASVVAYAVLVPIQARAGWMVEWIIQGNDAPNGTASLLLDAAFRTVASENAKRTTLGLVALSSFAPHSAMPPPIHIRALLAWTRAHSRRFYNFEGLERFKAKFRPTRWETIRLYVDQPQVGLSTLHALADAFAGERSPVGLVSEALFSAARAEMKDAYGALRHRVSSMLES